MQVAWHPHSAAHFAMLTSDNAFSIFTLRQPSTPEQLFKINPPGSLPAQLSILSLEAPTSDPLTFCGFAIGSVHAWDPILVYLLTRCAFPPQWPRPSSVASRPHNPLSLPNIISQCNAYDH